MVTELPYMVGPEKVIERISDGVKNRKLEGISGAFDLTDRHNGTRIVIEIKTGFDRMRFWCSCSSLHRCKTTSP